LTCFADTFHFSLFS